MVVCLINYLPTRNEAEVGEIPVWWRPEQSACRQLGGRVVPARDWLFPSLDRMQSETYRQLPMMIAPVLLQPPRLSILNVRSHPGVTQEFSIKSEGCVHGYRWPLP
jgi:hypothetical protein